MRILIVEDDAKTAAYLHKGLSESGFTIDRAATGEEGFHLARTRGYELIILDIMLPGRDGFSVIQELRTQGHTTPVLILTACDAVEDRVKGLDSGADDYLVKPFAFTELLARLRSILRRRPSAATEVLVFDDLKIDVARRKVMRGDKKIELTTKDFDLLLFLARRQGEVQSRTTIAQQVWDINFLIDSNVVDVHIRRLRARLDDPFETKLIHSVRGVGYLFESRAV